jgi:hypothetical protein
VLEGFNLSRGEEMEINLNNRFDKFRRTEPLEPGRYTLEISDVMADV